MNNQDLDFRNILVREPFYYVLPKGYLNHATVFAGQSVPEPNDRVQMLIVTQADFLRQYYPSGHKINDPVLYPDVYKQDPETKQWFIQPVTRYAFAFQRVIKTKQVVHLVGNDVQFELSGKSGDEATELRNNGLLLDLRQGWLDMDMETVFYEAVDSIKTVGDAAVVGYFDGKGRARAKTLSFLDGDTLYPHYGSEPGRLELFARKYRDFDEEGNVVTEWVEVWDDTYLYRAKRGISSSPIIQRIKEVFGLAGFTIVSKERHGFNFVPVAYYREREGACWAASQDTIEAFEEAFSYFGENNKANAFPIFYTKGEGVSLVGDLNGAVKSIDIPDLEGEAGYIQQGDVSASYNTMLTKLYDLIYEQSFAVKPPELKSGDLPGVAIKLLYSPAIEQAIHDSNKLSKFLHQLIKIVKFAYGWQINKQASLLSLNTNTWIEPYVHQNDTELVTNLASAVQNGFLSKQTASERIPKYAKNDEIDRIMREDLRKRKLDTQDQINLKREQLKLDIEKQRAQARINRQQSGSDVNTGNRRIRTTDQNGNRPGENNWDDWNKTH